MQPTQKPALSANKRQILIVDDEQINSMMLGANLENEYEVLYASDGREALELMRTHCDTLSLVLLDLMMPVMSGFDVLEAVMADDAIRHIPIIVETADKASEVQSLQLGAIDCIPKPYQTDVVLARIRRIIELRVSCCLKLIKTGHIHIGHCPVTQSTTQIMQVAQR